MLKSIKDLVEKVNNGMNTCAIGAHSVAANAVNIKFNYDYITVCVVDKQRKTAVYNDGGNHSKGMMETISSLKEVYGE